MSAIDKSNAIKMLQDIVFLEIDEIILNWNTYSFSVHIDTPGTKTVVFRLANGRGTAEDEAVNRELSPNIKEEDAITIPNKIKPTEASDKEHEATDSHKENDVKDPEITVKVEDHTTGLFLESCTVEPTVWLEQRRRNPDPEQDGNPWHYRLRRKRAALMEPLEQGTSKNTQNTKTTIVLVLKNIICHT
ncbi:hypothetical protein HYDPIDRAFT_33744 [Hydnomerulius pinastri MD-312]|uniref:Uncharacterized protein n=1 Tax=Hydnomerulius pinastri MD-312 TaxID=994086 RepID=A0A0C9W7L5_9AGAM|nr:hypothetical protein HYDPIDRAFT_33744 [Hydnomerulius pinastri MD-312]